MEDMRGFDDEREYQQDSRRYNNRGYDPRMRSRTSEYGREYYSRRRPDRGPFASGARDYGYDYYRGAAPVEDFGGESEYRRSPSDSDYRSRPRGYGYGMGPREQEEDRPYRGPSARYESSAGSMGISRGRMRPDFEDRSYDDEFAEEDDFRVRSLRENDRDRPSSREDYGYPRAYESERDYWRNRGSSSSGPSSWRAEGNWRGQESGPYSRTRSYRSMESFGSTGPFAGRGPKGFKRSDEELTRQVCERLEQHGEIDASEIEVGCKQGCIITLSGEVPDRQTKRLAEDIAQTVYGVKDVDNDLRVNESLWERWVGDSSSEERSGTPGKRA